MAEKGTVMVDERVTLSKQELAELLKTTALAFREAQKDPLAEARKEAGRIRLREEQERQKEVKRMREAACSHLREDNTSAVAWMKNSDDVTRGVCQRCNTDFAPGHPKYNELMRIPTRAAGIIYW